ncbi:MAG: porin [Pseudomonadota bacterium]
MSPDLAAERAGEAVRFEKTRNPAAVRSLIGKSFVSALGSCAIFLSAMALTTNQAIAADDPVELEISGEASVVAGVSDGDGGADADAEVRVKASTVLDNGIDVGAVLEGRLDGQQPDAIFAGGRYSGLTIGGPRGVAPATSDVYLQSAYAYARGSFGEINVGRVEGVSRSLAVTAPTIFRAINVNDWRSDLTGLNDVHTINDFTGYATKITYLAPANFLGGVLGGLQMGVSYSPTLRDCGQTLCAPEGGLAITPDGLTLSETSNWEDGVETALYYQTRINGDVLVGLGASYVAADEDARSVSPVFEDYEAYSIGLNLAYRGITLGGSIKSTNAGLSSLDEENDGYLAFDAGVTFKTGDDKGDWGVMLGYGQSEASVFGLNPIDPTLFQDTQTAQAGFTYFLGRGVTVGAAAQFLESTRSDTLGGPEEAATVVIESSIRF